MTWHFRKILYITNLLPEVYSWFAWLLLYILVPVLFLHMFWDYVVFMQPGCYGNTFTVSIPTFLDRDEYTKTSRERRREGALSRTRASHKPSGFHVDTWNCRAGPQCLRTKQTFRLLPERARCAPRAKQNSRGQRGEAALGVWKSSVSHLCPLVGKNPTHFIGTRCSERKRWKKREKETSSCLTVFTPLLSALIVKVYFPKQWEENTEAIKPGKEVQLQCFLGQLITFSTKIKPNPNCRVWSN